MKYKQVKLINTEGVAFLAWDMPTHARDMPTHQDVHTRLKINSVFHMFQV